MCKLFGDVNLVLVLAGRYCSNTEFKHWIIESSQVACCAHCCNWSWFDETFRFSYSTIRYVLSRVVRKSTRSNSCTMSDSARLCFYFPPKDQISLPFFFVHTILLSRVYSTLFLFRHETCTTYCKFAPMYRGRPPDVLLTTAWPIYPIYVRMFVPVLHVRQYGMTRVPAAAAVALPLGRGFSWVANFPFWNITTQE